MLRRDITSPAKTLWVECCNCVPGSDHYRTSVTLSFWKATWFQFGPSMDHDDEIPTDQRPYQRQCNLLIRPLLDV
jgi:hypothetical protein